MEGAKAGHRAPVSGYRVSVSEILTHMKPYFEDASCVIYHGDAKEVLAEGGYWDLLLTDPPYGVSGEQNSKASPNAQRKNDYSMFKDSPGYVQEFVIPIFQTALAMCRRAIVTPGNRCLTFYPPPTSFGCFWQPASVGLQPWGRADSQPIFYYGKFPHDSQSIPGQKCSHHLVESPERNGHPCPKPIDAWRKLILCGSLPGETILDPFMGSGTTLRAAKDLGRKAVGIEICEEYAEIAANRLSQEVLAL